MAKKKFKTESKKLLDMMINSIYTHKEVFLRELISNASDACDKLRFRSLTDDKIKIPQDGYEIWLEVDKDARTLTISDNGCGMTMEELEKNLGTIAKSGSFDFKAAQEEAKEDEPAQANETEGEGGKKKDKAADAKAADAEVAKTESGDATEGGNVDENADTDDGANSASEEKPVDIIGQFGVGFYSAFMVADKITVVSKAYGEKKASIWESEGVDGYTIGEIDGGKKDAKSKNCATNKNGSNKSDEIEAGTTITLHIKPDTDTENYSEFLDEWKIKELIKKYSDYIHYPIKMMVEKSRKIEKPEEADKNDESDETNAEDKRNDAEDSADNSTEDNKDAEPEYETYEDEETLNSMVPIWKRAQSDVTDEEYANFYQDKFYDYEAPLKVIRQKSEGTPAFESLLFIPAVAPYNYYSRDFEKGLQLYSSGVLIMERCKDLLPDYFSFVKGLVDSDDFTLNISRETLQHDRQLKVIAKAIERKVSSELKKMQANAREDYEKFYKAFGTNLKYGIYADYGMHKDVLQDLIMFKSSYEVEEEKKSKKDKASSKAKNVDGKSDTNDKLDEDDVTESTDYKPQFTTLKEYVSRMKEDQDKIYYCAGDSVDKIKMLPQVEAARARGFEVLYLIEEVDEFAVMMMRNYDGKDFANVTADNTDLSTDAEKELIKKENEDSKDILTAIKEAIGDGIMAVKFTNTLGNHPVCLSNEGELSANMEKTLSKMPGAEAGFKAQLVLEINLNHPIAERLKSLYESDKDRLAKYAKVLYMQARLISGMPVENPSEAVDIMCDIMTE